VATAPKPTSQSSMNTQPYNATIVDWRDCNDTLAVFTIEPDAGAVAPFEAGQYATIGLPREHPPVPDPGAFAPDDPRWKRLWRRAFTIASPATQRDRLEFYGVFVDDGKMTPKLWHAWKHGDRRIWIDDHIRGEFTLSDVPPDRDLVMAGTGTGIAPYLSMYRTFTDARRWRRLVLIEECEREHDFGYREDCERWASEDDTFTYLPVLTRDGGAAKLINADHVAGVALDPETCHAFLCGDPRMIDAAESPLLERGFAIKTHKNPGGLHVERYW